MRRLKSFIASLLLIVVAAGAGLVALPDRGVDLRRTTPEIIAGQSGWPAQAISSERLFSGTHLSQSKSEHLFRTLPALAQHAAPRSALRDLGLLRHHASGAAGALIVVATPVRAPPLTFSL